MNSDWSRAPSRMRDAHHNIHFIIFNGNIQHSLRHLLIPGNFVLSASEVNAPEPTSESPDPPFSIRHLFTTDSPCSALTLSRASSVWNIR